MRRASLLLFLAASLTCTQALADEPLSPQVSPQHDLDLDLRASGFGPYGLLGLSVAYAPTPAFAVELGGGWSPAHTKDDATLDLSAALQLRRVTHSEDHEAWMTYVALALSYTPSFQRYDYCFFFCKTRAISENNFWSSLEVGIMKDVHDAWRVGLSVGLIYHLYAAKTTLIDSYSETSGTSMGRFLYPYLGMRVGFDLGL